MTGYVTPAAPLRAFVAELVAAGVRDAVVCPGSRSMPMALALRAHPGMRVLIHLDERAAAFFALGLAKASRRPVAVLGTSGTAVVNFAPAVVEAYHGRVPLIVLTADRPPELRDRGARPDHRPGAPLRPASRSGTRSCRCRRPASLAEAHRPRCRGRAVATATEAPSGPVQLNLPFRASLLPDGPLAPEPLRSGNDPDRVSSTGPVDCRATLTCDALGEVIAPSAPAAHRGRAARPGRAPRTPSRVWPRAAGAPIVADALANLRLGPHDRSHLVARPGRAAPLAERSAPATARPGHPDRWHPDVRGDARLPGGVSGRPAAWSTTAAGTSRRCSAGTIDPRRSGRVRRRARGSV